jgi:hypothetical protein
MDTAGWTGDAGRADDAGPTSDVVPAGGDDSSDEI